MLVFSVRFLCCMEWTSVGSIDLSQITHPNQRHPSDFGFISALLLQYAVVSVLPLRYE